MLLRRGIGVRWPSSAFCRISSCYQQTENRCVQTAFSRGIRSSPFSSSSLHRSSLSSSFTPSLQINTRAISSKPKEGHCEIIYRSLSTSLPSLSLSAWLTYGNSWRRRRTSHCMGIANRNSNSVCARTGKERAVKERYMRLLLLCLLLFLLLLLLIYYPYCNGCDYTVMIMTMIINIYCCCFLVVNLFLFFPCNWCYYCFYDHHDNY